MLHADLAALAPMVGTWEGQGHGEYPTIDSFDYRETITFSHGLKPVLAYTQRTRHAESGAGLHAESGYLRLPETGRAELVVAQPTGIVEVLHGTITADAHRVSVDLTSTDVARTATAAEVMAVQRRFTADVSVDPPVLHIELAMAAVGHPMTHHLSATLHRQAHT